MALEQFNRLISQRMVAEIRRQIGDPEPFVHARSGSHRRKRGFRRPLRRLPLQFGIV